MGPAVNSDPLPRESKIGALTPKTTNLGSFVRWFVLVHVENHVFGMKYQFACRRVIPVCDEPQESACTG